MDEVVVAYGKDWVGHCPEEHRTVAGSELKW